MNRSSFLTIITAIMVFGFGNACYANDHASAAYYDYGNLVIEDCNFLLPLIKDTKYEGEFLPPEKRKEAEIGIEVCFNMMRFESRETTKKREELRKEFCGPIRHYVILNNLKKLLREDAFERLFGNSATTAVLEQKLRAVFYNTMAGEYDPIISSRQKAEILKNVELPMEEWSFVENYYK